MAQFCAAERLDRAIWVTAGDDMVHAQENWLRGDTPGVILCEVGPCDPKPRSSKSNLIDGCTDNDGIIPSFPDINNNRDQQ
ncbi:hypothetical protein BST61_g320 [Cercospora zeina]